MRKFKISLALASVALIGVAAIAPAFAAVTSTPITFPSGLTSAAVGLAGAQLADPEVLLLLVIATGVPFGFWAIGKAIHLVPGTKK